MIQKAYQIFNTKNEASERRLRDLLLTLVMVVLVFALFIREIWSIITYSAVTFILMLLLRKTWLDPSWSNEYEWWRDKVTLFYASAFCFVFFHGLVMLILPDIDPEHYPDSNHLPTAK
jgi:hypothetical protein